MQTAAVVLFRKQNRFQLNARILHLRRPEEVAQLFRPLLELVQVSAHPVLELGRVTRPFLAFDVRLDVLVQVLVRIPLGTVGRQVKQLELVRVLRHLLLHPMGPVR